MAAAAAAAEGGIRVALLDGGGTVGGQFWRSGPERTRHLLHGRDTFAALRRRMAAGGVHVLTRHQVVNVWWAGSSWSIRCLALSPEDATGGERAVVVTADRLVLAT